MNKIKLKQQNNPDIDELNEMTGAIKAFLDEEVDSQNSEWIDNINTILDFQDSDGSFKLFETYDIPSDARVDFCHMPTYICTAILMKVYLLGDSSLTEKVEESLIKGLEMSCMRNLHGHGYESREGQIEALNIFMKGGLREFIDLYPEMNPEFTSMISNIRNEFANLEKDKRFKGPWGEDYKDEILKINRYFRTRRVFVYGTLMRGECNHKFLENSEFLGMASVEGYEMYNVGWYPAIIHGDDMIPGELYEVPKRDMRKIDGLEGEGSLYIRRCEMTSLGLAYIYEYALDTSGLERIDSWKDYIWYVSYGSNMLYERFLTYIEGGCYEEGGSWNEPCADTSSPREVKAIELPYDMYFANYSGSWDGCGVSFLDITREGHALGVAYLITREQLDHVAKWENNGVFPGGGSWYNTKKSLGKMDGFEMVTVTNDGIRPYNRPCADYRRTLKKGIAQNWPDMSDEDIDEYLDICIKDDIIP